MPDSPAEVQKAPTRCAATPPAMPPPPASGNHGAPRAATYTPTAMMNGSVGSASHSPTAASIGGSPASPPNGYHGPSPSPSTGSSSSSSSSLSSSSSSAHVLSSSTPGMLAGQHQSHNHHHHHHHHSNHNSNHQHHHQQQQHQHHQQQPVPAACGARQLSKLKRFLATLQQFGSDISPEIGERVRGLVLGLVNSTVTIEEFHSKLQEATNFPLRPFVIPFLKANLPLLQRELLQCARVAKQSPAQYLAQNQFLLLDVGIPPPPPPPPPPPLPVGVGSSTLGHAAVVGTMPGSHHHQHQQHQHQAHHGPAVTPPHHHQHHHHQHHHQASSPFDPADMLLEVNENGKRSLSDRGSRENGLTHDSASKRQCPPLASSSAASGTPLNGAPASSQGALASLASPLGLAPPPGSVGGTVEPAGQLGQGAAGLSQPAALYSLGGGGHHRRAEELAHGGGGGRVAHNPVAAAVAQAGLYREEARGERGERGERHRQLALPVSRPEEVIDHRLTEREWAEEWKHLDYLLSCILEMVEKTRRAISVLRRCQETDRHELARWVRRCCSDEADPPCATAGTGAGAGTGTGAGTGGKKNGLGHAGGSPASGGTSGIAKQLAPAAVPAVAPAGALAGAGGLAPTAPLLLMDTHQEFLSRPGSRYMPEEVWRKAEEAVNEVKRQAMTELQKAVSDAERQARCTIAGERARMERALADAKRQAASDAIAIVARQDDSSESCWNCGRKASETCSGCNAARYCGAFCQHKDWERHHHVCGQRQQQKEHHQQQHHHHHHHQHQPKLEPPPPQPAAEAVAQTAAAVKGGCGGGGGGGAGGGARVGGGSPDDGAATSGPATRPDSPIIVESAAPPTSR